MIDNRFQNRNINKIPITKEKKKVKYSLLTFVLLICIIELTVSAVKNINKTFNFVSKIHSLEAKKTEEVNRNKQLKSEMNNYNTGQTLEAIVRDNLKLADKNEILIIINKPKEPESEEVLVNNKKK